MDENKEQVLAQEKTIPVFAVFKKGLIFKNIFLLDQKTSPSPHNSGPHFIKSEENGNFHDGEEDNEEVLLVGRHPDCNIMLEHPSISRFHLQIHLQPSLQKLYVIDLSSAHGTWVSDQRIESQVRVELREGDMLRLGVSTRSYRLHWFPLRGVLDVDNTLVPLNFVNPSRPESDEEEEEEMLNNENLISFEKNPRPSAPPIPEYMNFKFTHDAEDVLSPLLLGNQEEEPSPIDQRTVLNEPTIFAEYLPLVEDNQESPPRRLNKESSTPSIWSRRGKPASLIRIQTSRGRENNMEVARDFAVESEKQTLIKDELSPNLFFSARDRGEEIYTPGKENYSPKARFESKSVKKGKRRELELQTPYKSASSSRDENEGMLIFSDRENVTPIVLYDSRVKRTLSGSRLRQEVDTTISKRRAGKSPFQSQVLNSISNTKSELPVGITDTRSSSSVNCDHGELTPKLLFSSLDDQEEIFTPNKENYTPKSGLGSKSITNRRRLELELPKSSGSISTTQDEDQGMSPFSEKENQTPTVLHDSRLKKPLSRSRLRQEAEMIVSKRRAGRVPFQSLMVNSISNIRTEVSVHSNSPTGSTSVKCHEPIKQPREARKWYMVVDTNCLLDKESRKSLQLLQGLKGTQLIIPRMVIRELDCLRKHGSLFRSVTEISKVLEWIEECMVKKDWWIHIQNSMEESRATAPTPSASPKFSPWISEGSSGAFGRSMPSSPWSSAQEMVSPTAEDHVLDCALLFRRIMKDDGQVVLLSNDIALKIKAMSEGLLCENAEEFRNSLVNPYSERFLWVGSTPRGPTWSCSEDASQLEKNNYCIPAKKTQFKTADCAAKGLKLILLHNYSHYGQMNVVR